MNYTTLATPEIIKKVTDAFAARNVTVHVVNTKAEALEAIKTLIPAGSEVMSGGSTTLNQIGYIDYLKEGNHGWKNVKDAIMAETDPVKQTELRQRSVLAPYFLGSVHAITEDGQAVVASASGSQIPSYAYTSDNVIWVAGTQKIVPTLADAMKRVETHVFPLEDARMKEAMGFGSVIGMWWIFEKSIMPNRKFHLILVNEELGF